jgi:hypothetical protein
MSTPIHANVTGTFVSDGAIRNINIPSGYDEFSMINITDIGSAAAATPVMRAYGTSFMAPGSAYYNLKTNGAATVQIETTTLTGGFTFVADSGNGTPSNAVVITGITNAAPPVVSTGSTAGLNNFDIVRVYGTTGQLNIAGMDFTINNIVLNTSFELIYMVAPGAAATAGFWRRIPFDARYYPRRRFITSISLATSAVIVMSVTHGFTVGQKVRMIVPVEFGMTQMNGLLGTVTAINTTTNSITVDIDSTAFTAFAFPTSAVAAAAVNFAQVVPVGEAAVNTLALPVANLLDDATDNVSFRGVQVGTTVQTTGVLYQWFAKKGVTI